jgi:hypothetical protein
MRAKFQLLVALIFYVNHIRWRHTLSVAIFIHSSKLARIGTFATGVCWPPSTDWSTVPFGVRGGEEGMPLVRRKGDPWAAATTFFRSRCLLATRSSRRRLFSAESSFINESVASAFWGAPTLWLDLLRCIVQRVCRHSLLCLQWVYAVDTCSSWCPVICLDSRVNKLAGDYYPNPISKKGTLLTTQLKWRFAVPVFEDPPHAVIHSFSNREAARSFCSESNLAMGCAE